MRDGSVNQTELSALLGISPRAIRKLHSPPEGLPHYQEGAEVRYPVPAVFDAYYRKKLDVSDQSRARTRKLEAEAALKEAKVRLETGMLVHIDWALDRLQDSCTRLRQHIDRVPRLHGSTVRPDDPDAGTEVLQEVVDDLLRELSTSFDHDEDPPPS